MRPTSTATPAAPWPDRPSVRALGELADGEARTIHLTVSVGVSLGERTVTNTARVSSATFDPNLANNTASASLQTGPAADVAIEKTGPASVVSGASIAWTLKVTDKGPSTAHQVIVEDPLPSGVTLTHAAATQGTCQSMGSVLRCELGTLADGAAAGVTVTGTVTATSGTLSNTATVRALEPDPEPADNSSTATTTVLPAPVTEVAATNAAGARARVTLRKLADRTTVRPGEEIRYRLIVHDLASVPARHVRVCDALPSQTTVVDRGGGHLASERICFALPTLTAGAAHTFKITLRADSNARRSILNRASASGANFNTVHAHVSTAVKGSAAALRESGVTG